MQTYSYITCRTYIQKSKYGNGSTYQKLVSRLVDVSQANRGLIAKDLIDIPIHQQTLKEYSVKDLASICKDAAHHFTFSNLPLDDTIQSPEVYIKQLSGTTGMPEALCKQNMEKNSWYLRKH